MFITIEGANPYVYMMWSTGAMFNLNKDPNNLTLNSTMSLVIWVIQHFGDEDGYLKHSCTYTFPVYARWASSELAEVGF